MATSVYNINKGINKPIEFRGLKAQYIGYLGVGLLALLILFAILYISGVNMFICLGLAIALTTALFMNVYRFSNKYGEHGLMKLNASRRLPSSLVPRSRKLFLNLKQRK
jgi:hypothetical protein